MNTIQDTALLDKLNAGIKPDNKKSSSNELKQSDFFELMIAQLKNQDPTKPMDGQQYLAQLAQFSTVNSLQEIQKSFSQLSQSLQSLQSLQASSLVGRQVMVAGDHGYLAQGGSLQGSVALTEDVNDLTVTVTDSSGQPIRHLSLGKQSVGPVAFSWNGMDDRGNKVVPGIYQLHAQTAVNGAAKEVETWVRSTVQSVSLGQGGQGMTLNLAGLGTQDFSTVREVF
jgi:flagellar basal-body rod modification protein FlgD